MPAQEALFAQEPAETSVPGRGPAIAEGAERGVTPRPGSRVGQTVKCLHPSCEIFFVVPASNPEKLYCCRRHKDNNRNVRIREQRDHATGHLIRTAKTAELAIEAARKALDSAEQVNQTALLFADQIKAGGHDPREARAVENEPTK